MQKSTAKDVVQVGLRLPRETYERLRTGDLGFSEEVRRRLAESFARDEVRQETRDLAEDVIWLADEIDRQLGNATWHTNHRTHAALVAAVAEWLEVLKPAPQGGAVEDLFGPYDPPTLGRAVARLYERVKAERDQVLEEILRRQGKTKRGRDRKIGKLAHYLKANK